MSHQIVKKIAIVTGANKGIGFAIVKSLAKELENGLVYLTARNEELGLRAVKDLEQQGIRVNYHQLDIDNIISIKNFANYIKEKYGGVDILINNAAISYKSADQTPFGEQASNTIRINFTGSLNMCTEFFPLLRPHARVVNISSRMGLLKVCKSKELREKLTSTNATIDDIVDSMNEFVQAAQDGKFEQISTSAYGMSKVGLNALTEVQQRLFDNDPREDLIVNSCTPGYVSTDMTSHQGTLTTEQGAQTPVYLALLPKNTGSPKGQFVAEKNVLDWKDLNI